MSEFKQVVECTNCPCRNIDYENGSECNLKYDMTYGWTRDKRHINCSKNCELINISYGVFEMKEFERVHTEVTDVRPENWVTHE